MTGKREDDAFLRKVIWFIGGLALTSAASIIAMQIQINANKEAVSEIRETNKTLNKINITLQKVLGSGQHRNALLLAQAKKQEAFERRQIYIFGEQKTRTPKFKTFERHMDNNRRHK